jgi:hypothetical protein
MQTRRIYAVKLYEGGYETNENGALIVYSNLKLARLRSQTVIGSEVVPAWYAYPTRGNYAEEERKGEKRHLGMVSTGSGRRRNRGV